MTYIRRYRQERIKGNFVELISKINSRLIVSFIIREKSSPNQKKSNKPFLRPVYTGDFCRSNSMQVLSQQLNAIFVASKLQLQNRA